MSAADGAEIAIVDGCAVEPTTCRRVGEDADAPAGTDARHRRESALGGGVS